MKIDPTTMKDWQIVGGQKENKANKIQHEKARPSQEIIPASQDG